MIRPLHPLSIHSFGFASDLKLSPKTPSKLSSFSFRFIHQVSFNYLLISMLLPLSVLFNFSTILFIFRVCENELCQPQSFGRPLCPLCIRFVVIGQWDRILSLFKFIACIFSLYFQRIFFFIFKDVFCYMFEFFFYYFTVFYENLQPYRSDEVIDKQDIYK